VENLKYYVETKRIYRKAIYLSKMFPNKKIQELIGTRVQVEMKGEKNILEGTLTSVDDYLNLFLTDTSEIVEGEKSRVLGSVILRGNNIILIAPVDG
jgi:small nuclear ribonucleoprotein (snRNP)-like protein